MWKRSIELTIYSGDELLLSTTQNRIDFIHQSYLGWAADELKIDIYNLAPETVRSLFERKDKTFNLKVGYEDGKIEELMTGGITNAIGRKVLPNHITSLWCIPHVAEIPAKQLQIKENLTGTLRQIITKLVVAAGYKAKEPVKFYGMSDEILDEPRDAPFPVDGTLSSILIKLGEDYKFSYQPTTTYIKIISMLTNKGVMAELKSGSISKNKITVDMLKEAPVLSVAACNVKVLLDASIKAGNVLDLSNVIKYYSGINENGINKNINNSKNLFAFSDDAVLFRDKGALNYTIYDSYQILGVKHVGSNYASVWETSIEGVVYNESGTAGDRNATDASGIPLADARDRVDTEIIQSQGSMIDLDLDMGKGAGKPNWDTVEFTKEQEDILVKEAGGDAEKLESMKTTYKIENRGHKNVRDVESEQEARGPGQFLPSTFNNLLPKGNIHSFGDSTKAMSMMYDENTSRYGEKDPDLQTKFHRDYFGSPSKKNWGPKTQAYIAMSNQLNSLQ